MYVHLCYPSVDRAHTHTCVYVYIGIIPRSIEQILAAVEQGRGNGWTYTLEASFLEIYNEAVRVLPALLKCRLEGDIDVGFCECLLSTKTFFQGAVPGLNL